MHSPEPLYQRLGNSTSPNYNYNTNHEKKFIKENDLKLIHEVIQKKK